MRATPSSEQIVTEDVWIAVAPEIRLRARIWWPRVLPAPAIMEQLPYRFSDFRADRDDRWFRFFAEAGYVGIRIDLRGSGNSDGLTDDEYSTSERADAVAVLDWISEQPWSDGSVGAIGISYSGFGALQLACRARPQLKAIVAAGFVDDRFEQDIHRIGGALHDGGLLWSQMFHAMLSLPPDVVQRDDWFSVWQRRLEYIEPPLTHWLQHQSRDDYWRQGSAIEHYEQQLCPIYAVSGWADRYPDGALSVLARYPGEKKVLIGPWEHAWPHEAGRGERLDFPTEALRWFDHWLRGIDTGILDEPRAALWMQEGGVRPNPCRGRWLLTDDWPVNESMSFGLSSSEAGDGGKLTAIPHPLASEILVDTPASVGIQGGLSAPLLPGDADQPAEQTRDDARSVCFDGDALDGPIEIVGRPIVRLTLTSSHEHALIAVRLSHVSPSGESALITTGLLKLSLAEGRERARPLTPGVPVSVEVEMLGVGYQVPAGHRLRLALSSSHWPWAWPNRYQSELALPADSTPELVLPLTAPPASRNARPPLPLWLREIEQVHSGTWISMAEKSSLTGTDTAAHSRDAQMLPNTRALRIDPETGETWRSSRTAFASTPEAHGGASISFDVTEQQSVNDADPASASYHCVTEAALSRGDWQPRVQIETNLTSDEKEFRLVVTTRAELNGEQVMERQFERSIAREVL